MAHGRRVGVMPESGGPDGNIAIGQHSPSCWPSQTGNAPTSSERIFALPDIRLVQRDIRTKKAARFRE